MSSFKLDRDLQNTLSDYYNYTRFQDHGGLLYLSNHCLHLTMLGLELFRTIMNEPETRLQLFAANSAENVFSKLFCQVAIKDLLLKNLEWSEGHKLTRGIIQCVARALFHVFCKKNEVSKVNSIQHGYSGKMAANDDARANTRCQAYHKRQKLQSEMKTA